MKCSQFVELFASKCLSNRLAQKTAAFSILKLSLVGVIVLMMANQAWGGKGGSSTSTTPTAPSNLTASAVSSNQITLNWQDNSSNESGFKIEQAPTASGAWKQIATVSANVTTYANNALVASTTYYYRLRAY